MQDATPSPMDRPPWAWRLVIGSVVGLLRDVFGWRVRVRRPPVLPRPEQPLVVVFNHTSTIDGFLLADSLWRRLRRWGQPLVKTELFRLPVVGKVIARTGAIPVARGEEAGREAAYGDAVARLREGGTIMVAPEGTTTHDGSLLPLRHGAARLALEAGVDVLVATHVGAQRGFSPIVRFPERGVVVTVALDLLTPRSDEDASSLTGRIAATMLDRSEELLASYPQADPEARWWPPYASPSSPTETARHNLERYRHSMAEAVVHARERVEELAEHTRERAEELAEQARERAEQLAVEARERVAALGDHEDQAENEDGCGPRENGPHPSSRNGRGSREGGEVPPVT